MSDRDPWLTEEEAAKELRVSAYMVRAEREAGKLMLGLEGERVMLRPSTAAMSVAEMSSLIEYCIAWAASRSIKLSDEAR